MSPEDNFHETYVEETKKDFNVYVGTETGILKGINLNQKAVIQKNFHKIKGLERDQEITSMAWGDEEETEVLMGLRNQTVRIFDTTVKAFVSSRKISVGTGPIVSLGRWEGVTLTAVKSGEVNLWRTDSSVVINALDGGEFLSCMRQDPGSPHLLATGGKEADLQLWDLTCPTQPTFRAKNVKPDMLQLRVPVWVSDIAYMKELQCIAVASRHKHVRLYDPQRQRRPTVNFEWDDTPLTTINSVPSSSSQVVVGTSHGRMGLFDLRGKKVEEPIHVFKGFSGAVRDISIPTQEPLIFSVALDRFLRVHHLFTGKLLFKEYLKSRLNCLLVREKIEINDFIVRQQRSKKRKQTPQATELTEPAAKNRLKEVSKDIQNDWESLFE